MTAATHAELAHLIARGDRRRAASLLVRDHAPAVLSLCRAMVRDPRLAEDLSQDAFARAFGALDGFRGEASPRTWLLRIARNRCLDHLDRARRAPWAVGGDDPEPDAHAADEPPPYDLLARREDAERAMAVLGESERALVVLHFGHGVGYPELADSFGLREGAVRMRISRALARMRAALAPERGHVAYEAEARTRAGAGAGWLEDDAPDGALAEVEGDRGAAGWLEDDAVDDTLATLDRYAGASEGAAAAAAAAAEWGTDADALVDAKALDADADLDLALDDELEVTARVAPVALEETARAAPSEPGEPPPVFDALRDDISSALRQRLDALAAAA